MHSTYKKMLKALQEKEAVATGKGKGSEDWALYILRCCDGSFYTGITKDLTRRFKMHQEGKASRYTRTRRPVEILYHEKCGNRTQALVRECAVKELSRKKKEELILSGAQEKRSGVKERQKFRFRAASETASN